MKELVILGGKESGVGAAQLATAKGLKVFVSDAGTIEGPYRDALMADRVPFEEKGHDLDRILRAAEVVKSPGIPDKSPVIQALLRKGVPVISEVEFASRYTSSTLIGITGTNGKTTTTMLTYHLLRKAGLDVAVAGNMGRSFAGSVAQGDHAYHVVELSSFQLDGIRSLRPHIAVLLNITPDHLDRYADMDAYVASKFRIAMNQTAGDHFLFNADDTTISEGMLHHPVRARKWPFSISTPIPQGGFLQNGTLHITTDQSTLHMSMIELSLQGKHNAYNSLAASIAARILEVRKDVVRESLSDFQNVEHRLEKVASVNGVDFINDSKATNVNSAWYALESMDRPVVWIAGGVDKGNDYSLLLELVSERVKAMVCLGTDNSALHKAFGGTVASMVDAGSAQEAVERAYELSEPGDVVLLSPACASFDLFENYEDRGRKFKSAVKSL
ncbi:MAG: UDP-N-acetylmuramoyl-L-alanine--D-glutamate ligase [Flavobacteriales bacterium]|nr:UDP-N-acetylmuramoyl-L-alanine--D-glutamate ligase [Flavobacteriales bacterium]